MCVVCIVKQVIRAISDNLIYTYLFNNYLSLYFFILGFVTFAVLFCVPDLLIVVLIFIR